MLKCYIRSECSFCRIHTQNELMSRNLQPEINLESRLPAAQSPHTHCHTDIVKVLAQFCKLSHIGELGSLMMDGMVVMPMVMAMAMVVVMFMMLWRR